MISFFRDFLDGPIYIVAVIICVILIMAIIGFIMERKKFEKEEQEKRVTVERTAPVESVITPVEPVVTPVEPVISPIEPVVTKMEPVEVREVVLNNPIENTQTIPNPLTNPETELKRDQTFTLNSNDVKVEEVVVANNNANVGETRVEDVATVIDFGSTEDIKIENL